MSLQQIWSALQCSPGAVESWLLVSATMWGCSEEMLQGWFCEILGKA